MFAIKFIHKAALGTGADEGDLDWRSIPGHGDYETLEAAEEACAEFDQAFDFDYCHRAFPVANDTEEA